MEHGKHKMPMKKHMMKGMPPKGMGGRNPSMPKKKKRGK